MSEFGAYEAETRFSELLQRVRRGKRVTITRHGHTIAELVPVSSGSLEQRRVAIERLRAFRSRHADDGSSLRELIDVGRRY